MNKKEEESKCKQDAKDAKNDQATSEFDLTILPPQDKIVERRPLKRPIHPTLPNIYKGSILLLIAKIRSGKTCLILNLLKNPNLMDNAFDHIFIISNTIHQDKTLDSLKEIATIYDHYDDGIVQSIMDYQNSFEDHLSRPRTCIVLDDVVNSVRKMGSTIESLACRSRHCLNGGLVVMASQQMNKIPVPMRTNATHLILFKTTSVKERNALEEAYADNFSEGIYGNDTFLKALDYATAQQYNFLYVNFDHFIPGLFMNFTDELYPNGVFGHSRGEDPQPDDDDPVDSNSEDDEVDGIILNKGLKKNK